MRVVTPYANILWLDTREAGIELLRKVEWYARISHRTEEKQTDVSWERFLKAIVLEHGDWSVTEHEKVTVDTIVDRGITHEWVRHRLGSYTQESTRFCNYGKTGEITVIQPNFKDVEETAPWMRSMYSCEKDYLELLSKKVSPQIARSVLPNSLASRIIVTYNLRSWRHFFIMRTCKEAHPQMKQVTIPLLAEFKEKIPLLYDDIIPEERQIDAIRRPQ